MIHYCSDCENAVITELTHIDERIYRCGWKPIKNTEYLERPSKIQYECASSVRTRQWRTKTCKWYKPKPKCDICRKSKDECSMEKR